MHLPSQTDESDFDFDVQKHIHQLMPQPQIPKVTQGIAIIHPTVEKIIDHKPIHNKMIARNFISTKFDNKIPKYTHFEKTSLRNINNPACRNLTKFKCPDKSLDMVMTKISAMRRRPQTGLINYKEIKQKKRITKQFETIEKTSLKQTQILSAMVGSSIPQSRIVSAGHFRSSHNTSITQKNPQSGPQTKLAASKDSYDFQPHNLLITGHSHKIGQIGPNLKEQSKLMSAKTLKRDKHSVEGGFSSGEENPISQMSQNPNQQVVEIQAITNSKKLGTSPHFYMQLPINNLNFEANHDIYQPTIQQQSQKIRESFQQRNRKPSMNVKSMQNSKDGGLKDYAVNETLAIQGQSKLNNASNDPVKHFSLTLSNQNLRTPAIIQDLIGGSEELNTPDQVKIDDQKVQIKSPAIETIIIQSESAKQVSNQGITQNNGSNPFQQQQIIQEEEQQPFEIAHENSFEEQTPQAHIITQGNNIFSEVIPQVQLQKTDPNSMSGVALSSSDPRTPHNIQPLKSIPNFVTGNDYNTNGSVSPMNPTNAPSNQNQLDATTPIYYKTCNQSSKIANELISRNKSRSPIVEGRRLTQQEPTRNAVSKMSAGSTKHIQTKGQFSRLTQLPSNKKIKVGEVHIFRNATTGNFNSSTLNHQSQDSQYRKSEKLISKRGVATGVGFGENGIMSTHSTQSLANEFAIHYLNNASKNGPKNSTKEHFRDNYPPQYKLVSKSLSPGKSEINETLNRIPEDSIKNWDDYSIKNLNKGLITKKSSYLTRIQKIKQESTMKYLATQADIKRPKSIRVTKKLEKVKTAVNEIKMYIKDEVVPNQIKEKENWQSQNTSHCTYHRTRKNYPLKKSEIKIISDETQSSFITFQLQNSKNLAQQQVSQNPQSIMSQDLTQKNIDEIVDQNIESVPMLNTGTSGNVTKEYNRKIPPKSAGTQRIQSRITQHRNYNKSSSRIGKQTKNIINVENFPQVEQNPTYIGNTQSISNALSHDIAELVDQNDNTTIYSTFRVSVNKHAKNSQDRFNNRVKTAKDKSRQHTRMFNTVNTRETLVSPNNYMNFVGQKQGFFKKSPDQRPSTGITGGVGTIVSSTNDGSNLYFTANMINSLDQTRLHQMEITNTIQFRPQSTNASRMINKNSNNRNKQNYSSISQKTFVEAAIQKTRSKTPTKAQFKQEQSYAYDLGSKNRTVLSPKSKYKIVCLKNDFSYTRNDELPTAGLGGLTLNSEKVQN